MHRLLAPALLFAALPAAALAASSGPAPTPGLGGPVVQGVCLLSREAVFANAKVGVAATARLRQIAQESETELKTERDALQAEARGLDAQANLTPDQRKAKAAALQPRVAAFQAKASQRSQEIEATRVKAMERISNEAQPVIATAYTQKGCGLLLDRNSVLGGNFANDLTAAVVQALDAKIQTITFNREVLPAAAAATTPKR